MSLMKDILAMSFIEDMSFTGTYVTMSLVKDTALRSADQLA